jgi:hypothetical protein
MGMMRKSPLLPPSEIEGLLGGHHVPGLTDERARILVARSCGMTVNEIAAARAKSSSAVRQDLQAIHRAVFDPIGFRPDPFLLAWWVVRHRECCLAAAFAAAEKSALLTG